MAKLKQMSTTVFVPPMTVSRWWCASSKPRSISYEHGERARHATEDRISVTRKIHTPMRAESNWVSALSKWCAT